MVDLSQVGAGSVDEFLDKLSVLGVPAIALLVALVAVLRYVGISGKWTPLSVVISGVVVAGLLALVDVPPLVPVVRFIVASILLGAAGAGFYSMTKRVAGWETVPPKSLVTMPDGQVVQTDTPPANKDSTEK